MDDKRNNQDEVDQERQERSFEAAHRYCESGADEWNRNPYRQDARVEQRAVSNIDNENKSFKDLIKQQPQPKEDPAISASAAFAARVQRCWSPPLVTDGTGSTGRKPEAENVGIRQKGGDDESVEASTAVTMARAISRSHRYSVRSTAAQQQQARSMAISKRKQETDNAGPSLAPGQESSVTTLSSASSVLRRRVDWTDMGTNSFMGFSHLQQHQLAMAPKKAPPVALRAVAQAFQREEDCRLQAKLAAENEFAGPSLAAARSTSAAAAAITEQKGVKHGRSSNDSADTVSLHPGNSPSETPAQPDVQQNEENFHEDVPNLCNVEDWSALVSATPARALEPSHHQHQHPHEDSNQELTEGRVSIVVRPGAFAIQGMDAGNDSSSEDPSFFVDNNDDDADEENDRADSYGNHNNDYRDPSDRSSLFLDEISGNNDKDAENGDDDVELGDVAPLEAELFERELVEANIVVDDDEDEFEKNPNLLRRLRMVQALVLCFSIAGIVCVILSAVTGFGEKGAANGSPVPVITGWDFVGGGGDNSNKTGDKNNGQTFGPHSQQNLALFGSAVAISRNGMFLVATSPGVGQGDTLNVGETIILKQVPLPSQVGKTTWQVSQNLPGLGFNDNPSASLSLSQDASVVAVGYPLYHNDGRVQIFSRIFAYKDPVELSFKEQEMNPSNVSTSTLDVMTGFGYSVDLSPDGAQLAVGAPFFESEPNNVNGLVRIYQQESTGAGASPSWRPLMENDFRGVQQDELFGWSVALRNNRIAVGGPGYDTDRGLVRVLEWTNTSSSSSFSWVQVGSDIVGSKQLGRFGDSVALSYDGTVLAVGARGTAFDPGEVRIFRWVKEWIADEKVFVGQEPGDGLGASVALSDDGNTLAIGAPGSNEFGKQSGQIQVWQHNNVTLNSQWTQHGSNLGGTVGSNMGTSVALSWFVPSESEKAVLRVVGGAPGADFDGSVTKAGSVFVFDRQQEKVSK